MGSASPGRSKPTPHAEKPEWRAIAPAVAPELTDARRQLHHAVQLGSALGISYLEPAPDDSHTNLEWLPSLEALFSQVIPGRHNCSLGVRPADLTLLMTDDMGTVAGSFPLDGRTMEEAARWVRSELADFAFDGARYTLKRHYTIPEHPVGAGEPFAIPTPGHFEELARWLGNSAGVLEALKKNTPEASDVRAWPHHFDIATVIDLGAKRTIGAGLELGDHYYEEPYFYVNVHPAPAPAALKSVPLAGGGTWHTQEWIGAVLPGSRLDHAAKKQLPQVTAFLDSAVAACRRLLTGS